MLYRTARAARGPYTVGVEKNRDAGLERIRDLEEQLSSAPLNSAQHRVLASAIQVEAALYRKSLDTAQAAK